MSLDITIYAQETKPQTTSGIYVRRNGQRVELSIEEAIEIIPGFEPVTTETNEVFSTNITHNLNGMASKCGLYEAMWRPYKLLNEYDKDFDRDEEYQFENENRVLCSDIIEHLEKGIEELKNNRETYEAYNPPNGWGSYDGLLETAIYLYLACCEYPEGEILTSR